MIQQEKGILHKKLQDSIIKIAQIHKHPSSVCCSKADRAEGLQCVSSYGSRRAGKQISWVPDEHSLAMQKGRERLEKVGVCLLQSMAVICYRYSYRKVWRVLRR